MYIYNIYNTYYILYMIFTTEGFFKVALESWPVGSESATTEFRSYADTL